MGAITFSIIIPTYNRRELLENAINSVLAQTFDSYELIVVDDGSEDDTFSLIKDYGNSKIIYVYKQNGGQNSAINIAHRIAKGEVIAFLDSDDIWYPERLEKVYRKYQSDAELGIVYHWTGYDYSGEIQLGREDKLEGWCYREVLSQGYLTSPSFLTCKKSAFDEIGDLDETQRACQDDDMCFQLCKKHKVGLIKEVLGVYGLDSPGQIVKDKKRGADMYLKLIEKYQAEIISECGIEMMKIKLNRAARLYAEIEDFEMENRLRQRADEL